MIDNSVAFSNPNLYVAFELVKIFLGIDQVKIVPRIRALDHHDEKIAAVVEILIADRRFKFVPIALDPSREIDRRLNSRGSVTGWRNDRAGLSSDVSHAKMLFRGTESVNSDGRSSGKSP